MSKEKQEDIVYQRLLVVAREHFSRGNPVSELEEELRKECEDIVLITVAIREARNAHMAEMQRIGMQYIIVGSVLGLLGFALTIIHFASGTSFEYALFGFTGLGISIVFWGLYKMFG